MRCSASACNDSIYLALKFPFESNYVIKELRLLEGSCGFVEQVVESPALNLHRHIARLRFTRMEEANVRQWHFEVSLPAEVCVGGHLQRFATLQ